MKKYILDFICNLEGKKSGIKMLHWDSKNLSQHKLCDDIATLIADYQDKVAEVEQSISGKLPVNNLKGTPYKVTNLKQFVKDVITDTNTFYSKLKKEGDNYIGMRSDTEAFLSDLQRQLYLVDFTIKEGLKERLRNKIKENRVTISNGRQRYSLTENELREFVSKAIHNIKEGADYSAFGNSEFISYADKLSDIRKYNKHIIEFAQSRGDNNFISAAMELDKSLKNLIDYIGDRYEGIWPDERVQDHLEMNADYDDYPPMKNESKNINEIYGLHGNNRKDWYKIMKKRLKQADDAEDEAAFLADTDFGTADDVKKAYDKVDKINKAGGRAQYFAHGGKSYISKKNKPEYMYFYDKFLKK